MSAVDRAVLPDEGIIKYQAHWQKSEPFPMHDLELLADYRQQLYSKGFIGEYQGGIGYGNISQRVHGTDQFYVSGSATGGVAVVNNEHFSRVDRVDVSSNQLWCTGPVIASSESMTHAVIYEQLPGIDAIMHAHHEGLWRALLNKVPTTSEHIAYGTPEMAAAVSDLMMLPALRDGGVFVMAGHKDGLFAFAPNLTTAMSMLVYYSEKADVS